MTKSTTLINNTDKENIAVVNIGDEMKKSYLDYAMSVIVSRAIPDVCDGLKPVHRRILFAMHEGRYDYNKPFKKSARIVGEVMGKYHPHGDSAIYDSLVRMAQDFSLRLPLVDGQGNFGSIDNDPPAAMRYTESRLQKVSHTMLADLDKDTVDFVSNYDGTEKEPSVMPAKFPNLLVNGSGGIAVGMATNIPPHNLGEVIDGVLAFIENENLTIEELVKIIPGPDFPTGGVILGRKGYDSAAKTGRGSVIMRGKYKIEENKKKKSIIITEIPYQVNKANLVVKIAELVKEKKVEGISDLRDESDRDGIRIVIDLKRDAMEDVIISQLYSFTVLQSSFGVNMLALNHGRPELLNLLDVIRVFYKFRKTVVTRRTQFLLNKVRIRAHMLIGLAVAVDNIDEVVALIRSSQTTKEAKEKLISRKWPAKNVVNLIDLVQDRGNKIIDDFFYFTVEQVNAILEMKLAKLTGLEMAKITDELNALAGEIAKYLKILSDHGTLVSLIKKELIEIKENFANPRRTEIEDNEFESDIESLIPKEDMVVVATMNGYIKRVPLSTYKAQKRGGKGRSGMDVRDEDITTNIFVANTHTQLLFFSTTGQSYQMKVYKLPLGSPQAKGRALVNLLPLDKDEKITSILPLSENKEAMEKMSMVFATSKGNVRRNPVSQFQDIRSGGKIAMKLSDNEILVNVVIGDENNDILLSTKNGKCIRFNLTSLRLFQSRNSTGVRGIKLDKDNEVISVSTLNNSKVDILTKEQYLKIPLAKRVKIKTILKENIAIDNSPELDLLNRKKEVPAVKDCELAPELVQNLALLEDFIFTVTENGFGKRTSSYEYRVTNRGGVGITNIITSARNGKVIASFPVENEDQTIIITNKGTLIRSHVNSIRIVGRNTQGVTLIKAKEGEKVVSVARVAHSGEEDVDALEFGEESTSES
ncbi:DNA gyrase subunit A [Flavobacteriaceae bacterium]|nr:DNA gyrase subunit A [Flavobacteriaceae bacterium]